MNEGRSAFEQRLDGLYREHPERFVARRDELAKELRAAGDRDRATRVKGLRRPTVAAWLINRAALESPTELSEFAEAGRELEAAQARALEGRDDGAAGWRAAAGREREATGAVVEIADRLAQDAGHPPSKRALELVVETLRAATADPQLRERVLAGRLEREQSAATLGAPAASPARGREAASAKRREAARAGRELERLEDELAAATAREERLATRVEETARALRQEEARLADSKRAAAELRRRLTAARRRRRR